MSINNLEAFSYTGKYQLFVKDNLGNLIKDLKENEYSLLVVDSKVSKNFKQIEDSLKLDKLVVDVNSETKSIKKLTYFLEYFSNLNLTRNNKILVLGGATMQDILGTACCLYHRGIQWTFVPTTILAQGDSCIGSKTSLDGFGKKNQFGVFYPPSKIFICRDFLSTLPSLEIFSGIGDILHYLLPYEESNKILKRINNLAKSEDIKGLIDLSTDLSFRAMLIKSELVKIDEFDKGPRKIFNFGHTFAHAIEKSAIDEVPHGVAVLFGMYIALNFEQNNITKSTFCEFQKKYIKTLLEIIIKNENLKISIQYSELERHIKADKKNVLSNKVRIIVPTMKEKSLWTSKKERAEYGLNYLDIDINLCLNLFNYLKDFKEIVFY